MHRPSLFASLALSALVGLSGCDSAGGGGTRDQVRVVGSSTVYPFAKAVAEQLARSNPDVKSPLIESTGSGGGIALFCQGVGAQTPDIANASRRMKPGEFATCRQNGVIDIAEIQVGLDGIAFASSKGGITMNLTPEIVYRALAANPYGQPQTNTRWNDIDPSLPDAPILVYGPPSTSGTRDAMEELIMTPGCADGPGMAALKTQDADRYDQVCTEVRTDGAYVDQGEQDNLIVQKIGVNNRAVGIFGYSYLAANANLLQDLPMNGVPATYENISSFAYPGARPLYIYVKKAHLDAIPGLKQYIAQWAQSWGPDGALSKLGFVSAPADVRAEATQKAQSFPSLDAATLQ